MRTPAYSDPRPARDLCTPEKVYGWMVEDRSGRVLGSVNHMLIDLHRGNVAYVIVAQGGFLGLGESRFPLAWHELELAPDGSHRLIWCGAVPPSDDMPASVPAVLLRH
jgi:hypothetical protein